MKTGKEIKTFVKDRYGRIAAKKEDSCCPGGVCHTDFFEKAQSKGYSQQELEGVPLGAVLGLGCGNPTALAELKQGETVLDLGSGAGIDVFLAAQKVGEHGKVIGVDMTLEMVEKAKECSECGECMTRCPYELPIPELIKENIKWAEEVMASF